MANEKHLAILKQGVEVWNKWRECNSVIIPELSAAKLRRANLSKANLQNADLHNADLSYANLRYADLSKANLENGDLHKADLSYAKIHDASLILTDLNGSSLLFADLHLTKLFRAYFNDTELDGANCSEMIIGKTIFGDVDLSGVQGLETVIHIMPSIIDAGAIYRSNGKIPDAFLRGAGLPDSMIGYIHSIAGAIQFYSCFISYSSMDQEFAERLYADLQAKGVRCWFAPEDLKIGDKFRVRIDESIRIHDKLLLVLSQNSLASAWVEKEVETAFEQERERGTTALFPIRLDDAVIDSRAGWAAEIKRSRHIGDFKKWKDHDSYQKAFDRLLRDLRAERK